MAATAEATSGRSLVCVLKYSTSSGKQQKDDETNQQLQKYNYKSNLNVKTK